MRKNEIKKLIKEKALDIGFNDVRFISAEPLLKSEEKFLEWREKGFAADMNYLLKENPINARPQELLKDAKTIIMFSANYYSECPPRPSPRHGRIAAYATGLDYHKVLRKKIKTLVEDEELKDIFAKSKFFTDAVPLLEKSFATKAGLGFRGKNTLLISRETGSFNFIAEIITDLDLVDDLSVIARSSEATTRQSHNTKAKGNSNEVASLPMGLAMTDITCGNCTRCIDICPTDAFPKPYQLDARKCISYHTIESRGEIPQELGKDFGEWFFGCDLCQTVCPYNKKAARSVIARSDEASPHNDNFIEFQPESGFGHWLNMDEIIDLELGTHKNIKSLKEKLQDHTFIDDTALKQINKLLDQADGITEELLDKIFQVKFARTPLLRPKRKGLIRNAKIVLNN